MNLMSVLTFCLTAQSWALVFEQKKVHHPNENRASVNYSKRYAGNMEACEQDEDCLHSVQKCALETIFSFYSVCRCPSDTPNYFDGTCHKVYECKLDSHCPHNMTYCRLNTNRSLGECYCSVGAMRDDGTCPQETYIPVLADYHSFNDVEGEQSILKKEILILSAVAVIIVIILFVGCWNMSRRNSQNVESLYEDEDQTQIRRQDSPSARRFLSTQTSPTQSPTRHQTPESPPRPIASWSRPQNTSLHACDDQRTLQDPPPSYEELFGSSVSP